MKISKIEARIWVLEREGQLIGNIDTDMIFHNSYLSITEKSKMGQYALKFLKNFEELHSGINNGDILIAGRNFGSGSSRQQAVDCFTALGVSAIIASSFGAIYKRNAINSGLPVLEFKNPEKIPDFKNGERIEISLLESFIKKENGEVCKLKPFSTVQWEIYKSGDIFKYFENL